MLSVQPGLRGSIDLRVRRKMAIFQLLLQSGRAKDLSAPLYVHYKHLQLNILLLLSSSSSSFILKSALCWLTLHNWITLRGTAYVGGRIGRIYLCIFNFFRSCCLVGYVSVCLQCVTAGRCWFRFGWQLLTFPTAPFWFPPGRPRGGTVVKVLCYKSEGCWFDSRWCHWNFSLT